MPITKIQHDSETSAEGKQVITACAFIHKNFNGKEKVFLPRRALTKKFLPGVFELPGGHINFGENLVTGLKREIIEEFHSNIKVGDSFYAFNYENKIKGSHSIEVIFFASFDDVNSIKLNKEDHSEYLWLEEKEIPKILGLGKEKNDPEIKAIYKGFSILKGKQLNFS